MRGFHSSRLFGGRSMRLRTSEISLHGRASTYEFAVFQMPRSALKHDALFQRKYTISFQPATTPQVARSTSTLVSHMSGTRIIDSVPCLLLSTDHICGYVIMASILYRTTSRVFSQIFASSSPVTRDRCEPGARFHQCEISITVKTVV
jgi:hypothetical protein